MSTSTKRVERLKAFDLYQKGLSQKEISKILNVSTTSMNVWVKEWKGLHALDVKIVIELKQKLCSLINNGATPSKELVFLWKAISQKEKQIKTANLLVNE